MTSEAIRVHEQARRVRISEVMLEANKHGDVTDAMRALVDDLHRGSFDGTADLSLAVMVLARALDETRAEFAAHLRDCPHVEPPQPVSYLQMSDRLVRLSQDAEADLDALDAAMDRAHIPTTWERSGGKQS